MTDATNQVVIWPFGQSTVIPAFFVAQTPQGFEDKSNDERSADHETQTTLDTRRPSQAGNWRQRRGGRSGHLPVSDLCGPPSVQRKSFKSFLGK